MNPVAFSKALADDTRWRIVRLILDEPLCVCELADILRMPASSVSSHVQIIRKGLTLDQETCGKWTYFRIHPSIAPLIRRIAALSTTDDTTHQLDLRNTAKRLAERNDSCCTGPSTLKRRQPKRLPRP